MGVLEDMVVAERNLGRGSRVGYLVWKSLRMILPSVSRICVIVTI